MTDRLVLFAKQIGIGIRVMPHLPAALYRAEQVRKIDQTVINRHHISAYELMQRAGVSAYKVLRQRWPRASKLCIYAGPGNNGGDGYVLARLARQDSLQVKVVQAGDPSRMQAEAVKAKNDYLDAGGQIETYQSVTSLTHDYDIAVDAGLGVGLDRNLDAYWLNLVEFINAGAAPVIALDIPTGINANTGCAMGAAIVADVTVCFIGLKRGLFTADAPDYCGHIEFASLDVPKEAYLSVHAEVSRINESILERLLPARKPTTHKGQCGHVLIIGGMVGFTGAALLAGFAALRTGAGLVSVGLPEQALAYGGHFPLELMLQPLEDQAAIEKLIQQADVIAIGPGLGQSDWSKRLFNLVVASDKRIIVDADGLNLLAKQPQQRNDWVLTPHPGEAARLLHSDTQTVQTDRFASLQEIVKKFQATVVLKGAGSLIASAGLATTYLCTAGNAGMASGGMGDVLTGVIASLCAQGLDMEDAARAAVFMHAHAADIAAGQSPRGLLASDLLAILRQLANSPQSV